MVFSKAYFILIISVFYCSLNGITAWSDDKKMKLNDVKTLTLHNSKFTTGRRSSPVPQVKCVGGSAGCNSFVPQVVQCYNRGSDGIDIQWECKTDMDNEYRFGKIQVTCEGYDYPDDPYVLKGSCGLEYTLDLTKEGYQKQNQYGSNYGYHHNSYSQESKKSSGFSDILFFAIVCLLMYAIYRSCLRRQQYSTTDDDFDNPDSRYGSRGTGFYPNAPPPPGFRPGYTSDDSCSGTTHRNASTGGFGMGGLGSTGTGGFWTGAMAGGALGYLFGNRNNNNRGYQSYSSPNSGGFGSWGSSSSGSSGSSGTRSASGFGGTSRR